VSRQFVAMLCLLLFVLSNAYAALRQTLFQVRDQTHYHWSAFMLSAGLASRIASEYLMGIPILFYTHCIHGLYLRELGLECVDNLSDNGQLVWKPMSSEGNVINQAPAKRVSGFEGNASGNAAHMAISASAIVSLWDQLRKSQILAMQKTVFIDFGCGTGFAVLSAATQPFARIMGVEIDQRTAALAQSNVEHVLKSRCRSLPVLCTNATIAHLDMSDFNFAPLNGLAGNSILLFMYEPLWTICKSEAHVIYHRVLAAAQKCERPVYVVYYYEGIWNGDALPALAILGAKQLLKWRYRSLNFACDSDAYLFKLN
jgi:SAM-dependent methyltransferase